MRAEPAATTPTTNATVTATTVAPAAAPAPARASADAAGVEFFAKNVRPVLVERCYQCHSASAKKLKAATLALSRKSVATL